MACGVPLVQPALGAFPEIIKQTNGGVIYTPNTTDALSKKWEEVLSNPEKIVEMSVAGEKSVNEKYAIDVVSEKVLEIYKKLVV